MATIKFDNISKDDLKDARLAGFKRSKPKKPKSKTVSSIENYASRYNEWVKDAKDKAKEGKTLREARKKLKEA